MAHEVATHTVQQGGQYCSCGQDAVTCQGCGRTICADAAVTFTRAPLSHAKRAVLAAMRQARFWRQPVRLAGMVISYDCVYGPESAWAKDRWITRDVVTGQVLRDDVGQQVTAVRALAESVRADLYVGTVGPCCWSRYV
jgi:hypothetical protein